MKLDRTLRSKVARRIFLLFVLCALVPILGLALVSYFQVRRQLTEQSHQRLYDTAKGKALGIFERLSFLETELALLASELADGVGYERWRGAIEKEGRRSRFRALILVRREGQTALRGESELRPNLTEAERSHLGQGKTLVSALSRGDGEAFVLMVRALELPNEPEALLVADLDPDYLWAVEDLPAQSELTVLGGPGTILFTTLVAEPTREIGRHASERHFRWVRDGEAYVSSSFELPLRFSFHASSWNVVLSEPEARLLASASAFMKAFPFVLLLSLWLVLLLSLSQIRRSLGPLERLKEGTLRIAERDFETAVEVRSGDEFEDLAHSFNGMAKRLGQQFHTLSTMSDIDRAVLSTLEAEEIVHQMHGRLYGILTANSIRITIVDEEAEESVVSYTSRRESPQTVERTEPPLPKECFAELAHRPEDYLIGRGGQASTSALAAVSDPTTGSNLVLPVVLEDKLAAVIALGYRSAASVGSEEQLWARQLVDRFAVALSNARLLQRLDRLNWGALVALARAIDAKSPWTAGHSERAAALGVAIGRNMGLTEFELDIVHRGGLLHDIGKIGIPPSILDKKGKLTDEEREIMKEHPVLGARILEPIEAYAKFIPVVLQHHEWFDGGGYPAGLSGDAISLYARVYAVADVYDALFADRPYRAGLSRSDVIAYIESRSKTQFDPAVVASFLELVAEDHPLLEDRSAHVHRLTGGFAESRMLRKT